MRILVAVEPIDFRAGIDGLVGACRKRLQDVELDLFSSLGADDVLFVDSTHVSKINSDINRLFFDILAALAPGVVIHFHDIFIYSSIRNSP